MLCFVFEVVDVVVVVIGVDKIVLCLLLGVYFNMIESDGDKVVFDYLLLVFEIWNFVYLYVGIFDDSMCFVSLGNKLVFEYMCGVYKGILVGVGSYSFEIVN